MYKSTLLLSATLMLTYPTFSQLIKRDVKNTETKMEAFTSKTGVLVKFIDTYLPDLTLSYGSIVKTRIRKMISGTEVQFFYQIEHPVNNSSNTASIEYADLPDVIKAIRSLKAEVPKDIALDPDYLENKFTTADGFQLSYDVSNGKASWFIKFENKDSVKPVVVNDINKIETAFAQAKTKIEDLKKFTIKQQ
ncbi:MAG TPA: hypothetical protein VN451_10840 [Chitinophagaceae bacterium]|nr:hypothetical protein [Chitinophagaceae bacterium]